MQRFKFNKKINILAMTAVFLLGWIIGTANALSPWQIWVNGRLTKLPVRVIQNMFFVSLYDLAQLPGWKIKLNLSTHKISLNTPQAANKTESKKQATLPNAENQTLPPAENLNLPNTALEANNENSGPPSDVRMTVQAALASLDKLEEVLAQNPSSDELKKELKETTGIVDQAINLLWNIPKTRTLQADLQVTLEDLQAQANLVLVMDQAQQGILPWSHPTAQNLLFKYPDLRPCHVSKGKIDGLEVKCAKEMLDHLESEDVRDAKRDLDVYQK